MTTPLALTPDAAHLGRALEAAHRFVRPRRGAGDDTPPTSAPARSVTLPEGEVRYWVEGDGAPVMLVHGWEGRPADLDAVAGALRAQGRALAWIELPAHGRSDIAWTTVPHAAAALARVGAALGPLSGVVGHSVGGALISLALGQGLQAGRVVLVAAPAEYREQAQAYARLVGLDRDGSASMLEVLARQYGVDVGTVSTLAAARGQQAAALVIHSRDDAVVPFGDAARIAGAWPGAVLMAVDGLGHRRVLADPAVVAAAVAQLGG